ncbi:MAG: hypothetical protein HYS05_07790 [Acidobacteria bacterium]|nr:hypothetical protein [Acidobacteriota bacterium]
MISIDCPREPEALEAACAGTWPDRCDEDLRAHVATCAICGEVVEVARALREDHDGSWRAASVPASGVVWWRAQMRARAEAARAAAKPITFVQGVAAACVVGGAIALAGAAFPWIRAWVASLPAVFPALDAAAADVPALVSLPRWLPLAAIVAVLLAPVAIYLAVTDD